jgi:hypothetical protein
VIAPAREVVIVSYLHSMACEPARTTARFVSNFDLMPRGGSSLKWIALWAVGGFVVTYACFVFVAIHDEWRPEWLVIPLATGIISTAMTLYLVIREVARLVTQNRKVVR